MSVLIVTSHGDIVIDLYSNKCPLKIHMMTPPQLADLIPDASHEGKPNEEVKDDVRLEDDWVPMDEELGAQELEDIIREKAAHSSAVVLESIGDIPEAEVKPPDNVLFVCKLNPVTEDEDLHTISSRFGTVVVVSADVIRDFKTGDSLCYAFIEFENKQSCEQAYFKMDNALIDDRRIHVDFSQSVSKLWSQFRQKDSQKGKGNGCFKCGSTDHVAKDCEGGNQSSKFIVKDQNRQHGGGEGYDMVFEGDVPEIPKRERSYERDERERKEKIRRRSPHGNGDGKRRQGDEGDDGRRQHHREELRELDRKHRERKERDSREDEDRRRRKERDSRSREDEDRRRRRSHEEMRDRESRRERDDDHRSHKDYKERKRE